MNTTSQKNSGFDTDEMVRAITKRVIEEFSPEESELVDSLANKFFSLEGGAIKNLGNLPTDGQLSFGGSSDLLVTYVIPLVNTMVTKLMTGFAEIGLERLKHILKQKPATHIKPINSCSVMITIGAYTESLNLPIPPRKISQKKLIKILNKVLQVLIAELSE